MINGEMTLDAPLRWAMVGGGRNSQIGYIHRSAALRDHSFQLVAGAFDIDAEAGRQFRRAGVSTVRTMVGRTDISMLAFFRSNGFAAGSFTQLELDLAPAARRA